MMGAGSDGSLNLGHVGGVGNCNEYSGATTGTSLPTSTSTPPETSRTVRGYSSMSAVPLSRDDSTASMMSMAGGEIDTSNVNVDLGHLVGSSAVKHPHHYPMGLMGSGHNSSSSSGGDLVSASAAAGGYLLTPSSSAHASNQEQQYHHQYPATTSVYDSTTDHIQQQQHYYHGGGSSQVLSMPTPPRGMPTDAGLWNPVKHEPGV